jgi:hypothetical protein
MRKFDKLFVFLLDDRCYVLRLSAVEKVVQRVEMEAENEKEKVQT